MKRVLASASILLAVGAFVFLSTGAKSTKGAAATNYKVEFGNAFGLVIDAPFKVSGIPAGKITGINLDQKTLNAVVDVKVTTAGTPAFHTTATCDSQPQSLIGEYFVSCEPGAGGKVLKSGATIPVSHTTSTIPADLLLDINQVPERDRLPLIINSLGAGVAGRSGDIQSALDRAIPALTETDNLLSLLANDSHTIQDLTVNADTVVTALAQNTGTVKRFIDYANRSAQYTAAQHQNLQKTLQELPGFLTQLRPAMAKLGNVAVANTPVATNLRAASGQLDRLFTELPGFADSALPAIKALGRASVTGRTAVKAATPIVAQLNQFSVETPDLAKNLSIVLPYLNSQAHATEPNTHSPGGKGYSGLEALLQFVFNLANATSYYGTTGHQLAVDAFVSPQCSGYATPQTIANNLAQNAAATRACYAFLGPNQPGVTTRDPSDPNACVPDPGGATPGEPGIASADDICKLSATVASTRQASTRSAAHGGSSSSSGSGAAGSGAGAGSGGGSSGSSSGTSTQQLSQAVHNLGHTLSGVVSSLGGSTSSTVSKATGSLRAGGSGSGAASSSSGSSSSAEKLLDYLLAP